MMRFITTVAVVVFVLPALAVPALQLYTPDGNYDSSTETWMATTREFELWAAWASHNGNYVSVSNLQLHIALLSPVVPGSSLTITGPGYESGLVISDFEFGKPSALAPHGIYPTYYYSLPLPDMHLADADELIQNYVEGDGADMGMVYRYHVALQNVKEMHFDLTAQMLTEKGFLRDAFAPYSHDAGVKTSGFDPYDETAIPEPRALFTAGILVAAFFRKRRRA